MTRRISAIPLSAIDAVVFDTETTGLDVKTARIIQIGGVRLHEGELEPDGELETFVAPGIPVPPDSTKVHGISDADLDGAPAYVEACKRFDNFAGERILIGHSVGFDLAVMQAESERAGLKWQRPRALCTRMLAQVVQPNLPTYDLEALASWLGVELSGRHSAIGDARSTARIFCALVPRLLERNVRTLAEAEAACGRLSAALEEQYKAGWHLPVRSEEVVLSEKALARVDAYPYRHRIRDLMSSPPTVLGPKTTLKDALATFVNRKISSVFVGVEDDLNRNNTGIITERDVLRAVAEDGGAALDHPIADYMNMPLESVFADAYLYRAMGRMSRLRIRHLAVIEPDGRVVGAISARDLLRLRTTDAISLGDEIDRAPSAKALGVAFARLPVIARGLRNEDIEGREVAGVVSRELCAMTRRAAELAETSMEQEGYGEAPAAYAVLVLGSGGRGESLLAADQDNAIVHADLSDADKERGDAWFAELGKRIADTLHEAGIPYCKGGIMASNEQWRDSVSGWKSRVDTWIRHSKPEDLLNVDIFYDMRAVHGDAGLADEIWRYAHEHGHSEIPFLKLLAQQAAGFQPPLGLFGGFKTENGRVDLKKGGLFPLVANARVLSIRHGILHRATPDRLNGVRALEIGAGNDLERAVDAHAILLDAMLDQQIDDIERGLPPSNAVEVASLSAPQQERLKRALGNLSNLDEMVRGLLFAKT